MMNRYQENFAGGTDIEDGNVNDAMPPVVQSHVYPVTFRENGVAITWQLNSLNKPSSDMKIMLKFL